MAVYLFHLIFPFTLLLIYFLNKSTGNVVLPMFPSPFADLVLPAPSFFTHHILFVISSLSFSSIFPNSHFPPPTDLTTTLFEDVWEKTHSHKEIVVITHLLNKHNLWHNPSTTLSSYLTISSKFFHRDKCFSTQLEIWADPMNFVLAFGYTLGSVIRKCPGEDN